MLDERDLKIIEILKEDARTPISEIAKELNISNTAVKKRIKKLEKEGVIVGYTIKTNDQILGKKKAMLIIHLNLDKFTEMVRFILESNEIESAYYRSSSTGYMFYLITEEKDINEIKKKVEKMASDICPVTMLEKLI